jgi:hypothetical protein
MMRFINHLIAILLITAVIPAGLPLHMQEDVSLDGRIALNDAVLLVKNLSTTRESRHGFSTDFSNMISALQTVAGIKTDPSSHEHGRSGPHKKTTDMQPDLTGLLASTFEIPLPVHQASAYVDYDISLLSLLIAPPSPPPKITC